MKTHLTLVATATLIASSAHAQSANWAWTAGKQTNDGSVTVKSLRFGGGTTYASTRNPTSAVSTVSATQRYSSQPPLVIPSGGTNKWSLYYSDRTKALF